MILGLPESYTLDLGDIQSIAVEFNLAEASDARVRIALESVPVPGRSGLLLLGLLLSGPIRRRRPCRLQPSTISNFLLIATIPLVFSSNLQATTTFSVTLASLRRLGDPSIEATATPSP